MGEVIEDPHIKERKAFIERNHPTAGPTTLLAPWIHMSKTPASIRSDSPALGQHTDEVRRYSFGAADINLRLKESPVALIGFASLAAHDRDLQYHNLHISAVFHVHGAVIASLTSLRL